MDMLQVLEGAAYVGFIAGAIFAVIELRAIKKDRRLEFWLRLSERLSDRDFVEAYCRIVRAKGTTAQELEDEISYSGLRMVTDYSEFIAMLGRLGLIDRKELTDILDFNDIWKKVQPWVAAERAAAGAPEAWGDLEEFARG